MSDDERCDFTLPSSLMPNDWPTARCLLEQDHEGDHEPEVPRITYRLARLLARQGEPGT